MREEAVRLFDVAASARTVSLRQLHSAPFSGDWLTDCSGQSSHLRSMSAAEWQDSLRYRLGLPLMTPGLCDACQGARDGLGDHAMCCASCGRYSRHNVLRDVLVDQLRVAGYEVTVEEQVPHTEPPDRPPGPGPTGPTLRSLRPADILVRHFRSGQPLAIDTTVVHPLRTSSDLPAQGVQPGVFAAKAETAKVSKYAAACHQAGWLFLPFGVEATGGWGPKARRLIQIIAGAQAGRLGISISEAYRLVALRLRAAVLCMVSASYGRCAAATIPSSEFSY